MWCTAESAGVLPARSWIMPALDPPRAGSPHSQGGTPKETLPGKPRGKPGSNGEIMAPQGVRAGAGAEAGAGSEEAGLRAWSM